MAVVAVVAVVVVAVYCDNKAAKLRLELSMVAGWHAAGWRRVGRRWQAMDGGRWWGGQCWQAVAVVPEFVLKKPSITKAHSL